MKTSELTGKTLDWAVAKVIYGDRLVHYRTWLNTANVYWKGKDCTFAPADEFRILSEDLDGVTTSFVTLYSIDWGQSGPIITLMMKEGMLWQIANNGVDYRASLDKWETTFYGPTLLIAAMRCYVASKFGDEIEIPEELKHNLEKT